MKSLKMNGLNRLLSFILIAVLLICIVGFAAGGWQSNPDTEPDSGDVGDETDETDENTNGENTNTGELPDEQPDGGEDEPPPSEDIIELPKFYNAMTGLEITEEQVGAIPLGFVLSPTAPLYGVSSADFTIEFPTENGGSRLLTYSTNTAALWKVGSLTATRDYISSSANFFGGVIISYGNDDIVKYSAWDAKKVTLDLSSISGCYYVENTLYIYTSRDMVNLATERSSSLVQTCYGSAPYLFADEDTAVLGTSKASSVIIPYSTSNETELYYSEMSGQYLYFKSGTRKVDMLNGKNISYTNVFVLFTNTTTYERSEGTELVVDTTGGGYGYYISGGYSTEIRWSVDDSGSLRFETLSGDSLTVNRGNAYICYYKSASSSAITIA